MNFDIDKINPTKHKLLCRILDKPDAIGKIILPDNLKVGTFHPVAVKVLKCGEGTEIPVGTVLHLRELPDGYFINDELVIIPETYCGTLYHSETWQRVKLKHKYNPPIVNDPKSRRFGRIDQKKWLEMQNIDYKKVREGFILYAKEE